VINAPIMFRNPFGSLFPDRKLVHLRYYDSVALNCSSLNIATQVYRANDLFDPDYTGTGHQPYGFDQLMTYYYHFVVERSTITLRPHSQSSPDAQMGLKLLDTATLNASTWGELAEQSGLVWANQASLFQSGKCLQLSQNTKRYFRRSSLMDDVQLHGTGSSSPAEQNYFALVMGPFSGEDPPSVTVAVTIDYWAWVYGPRELAQS
jgi:hypothetical protein